MGAERLTDYRLSTGDQERYKLKIQKKRLPDTGKRLGVAKERGRGDGEESGFLDGGDSAGEDLASVVPRVHEVLVTDFAMGQVRDPGAGLGPRNTDAVAPLMRRLIRHFKLFGQPLGRFALSGEPFV